MVDGLEEELYIACEVLYLFDVVLELELFLVDGLLEDVGEVCLIVS